MRGAQHTLAHRGKALRGGLALAASLAQRGPAPMRAGSEGNVCRCIPLLYGERGTSSHVRPGIAVRERRWCPLPGLWGF